MEEQFDLWPEWLAGLPWGGRSPRGLTRGAKVLYSRREPGGMSSLPDPLQCEMFIRHQARRYVGAPLLVEPGGPVSYGTYF